MLKLVRRADREGPVVNGPDPLTDCSSRWPLSREQIEVMVDGSSKPIRRFCRDIPGGNFPAGNRLAFRAVAMDTRQRHACY
jgi:hypothetical protein